MILYIASQDRTDLLDFLAEKGEPAMPVKKITGKFALRQFVIRDMRNFSHCGELVLDRQAFREDDAGFAEAVKEFLTMYSARVTVICEGMKKQSSLYQGLLDAGVENIVNGTEIAEIQSQIRHFLCSGSKTGELSERCVERETYCFRAEGVQIAVAGSQPRMGTTTAALGLAAWLGSTGAAACYVERNNSNVVSCLTEAYGMQPYRGGFQMENMWYGNGIPEDGYQFAVMDYGTGKIEKEDILLLICGAKPYELTHTMRFLQQYEDRRAYVLCPFVEESLREAYAEAFGSERHRILFLEYQPDCMDGSPNRKIFKEIVKNYIAGE